MYNLCTCLDILCDIDYVFTLVEDLNIATITRSDLSVQKARTNCFYNFVINNGLLQFVCEPTRGNNALWRKRFSASGNVAYKAHTLKCD